MPDNALNPALNEANKASSNAGAALDHAERSFGEAASAAKANSATPPPRPRPTCPTPPSASRPR
jgi:hypothetical protein